MWFYLLVKVQIKPFCSPVFWLSGPGTSSIHFLSDISLIKTAIELSMMLCSFTVFKPIEAGQKKKEIRNNISALCHQGDPDND